MAQFRYTALSASGALFKGRLEAACERDVISHLRGEGHYPVSARPAGRLGMPMPRRASLRTLAMATQELADMLEAGLELDRALGVLAGLRDAGAYQESFAAARLRLRDGAGFAEALAQDPLFPAFYVGMIRAGEQGGALPPLLQRLADYLLRTQAVRDSVLSALVYPMILLVTAGLSVAFILTFVLPSFEPLFESAGRSLPLPTVIVMEISRAFRDFWWAGALACGGAGAWLRTALRKPAFRARCDAGLLRLPLLGRLLVAIELERFMRTLGTLLHSAVPLPAALKIAGDVLRNVEIVRMVRETAAGLREGDRLARKLAQYGIVPDTAIDLMEIGEQTGRLDVMLLRQADHDERRIRQQLDRLVALLVPALTIVLGIVVAALISSILVAILGVNDLAMQ
ncbi:MAG: type II secretion system F family protein [Alphaproteobacteria bacterium]|nr:type II secretion system F family protein [Alphaproteobacteria bacterium]